MNVIPLSDGPSLFFAVDSNLSELIQEQKQFKLLGMAALLRI